MTRRFRAQLPDAVLFLPDDDPGAPYAVALETVMLARSPSEPLP